MVGMGLVRTADGRPTFVRIAGGIPNRLTLELNAQRKVTIVSRGAPFDEAEDAIVVAIKQVELEAWNARFFAVQAAITIYVKCLENRSTIAQSRAGHRSTAARSEQGCNNYHEERDPNKHAATSEAEGP